MNSMDEIKIFQRKFEDYLSKFEPDDGAHDISHFRRVWQLSQKLSTDEDDKLVLLAASYFHDFVNYPKDHPKRSVASQEAAQEAKKVLLAMSFPIRKIENVVHCIEAHSYSANIITKTNEAKVLQDADRMEALGAIGLARTFYVAGRMGTKLFDDMDPFAKSRELNDKRYAVDHFEEKLLKLPGTMKTLAGKKEAKKRAQILINFLNDLRVELGN